MIKLFTNIFNPKSESECEFLPNHVISISNGKISNIQPEKEATPPFEDFSSHLLLPGFIDLHTHLPQYLIRGRYYPALLPWLENIVFPMEARFKDPDFAEAQSRLFFKALLKAGTTFSVIYLPPFYQACAAAFEVAKELEVQALMGMTLMDLKSPASLLQTTDYAISKSVDLKEQYQSDELGYIYSPRFAPTCSEILCREIARLAANDGSFIQSHLSENKDELALVKEIFQADSYTEHYEKLGLLGPRSIMGHGIHLSNRELGILKRTGTKIAHCPESNFYLKSGEFPYARIRTAGVDFGLASDVGAGAELSLLSQAKLMNYRQSKHAVLPEELLYYISLGNARNLGLDERIGSIEKGKQADLLLFKVPDGFEIGKHSLSQLIFCTADFELEKAFVKGKIYNF